MSTWSIPALMETFNKVSVCMTLMASVIFSRIPYSLRISNILDFSLESKAFEKSRKTNAMISLLSLESSVSLRRHTIWFRVHLPPLNPFQLFRIPGSMNGIKPLRMSLLYNLTAIRFNELLVQFVARGMSPFFGMVMICDFYQLFRHLHVDNV